MLAVQVDEQINFKLDKKIHSFQNFEELEKVTMGCCSFGLNWCALLLRCSWLCAQSFVSNHCLPLAKKFVIYNQEILSSWRDLKVWEWDVVTSGETSGDVNHWKFRIFLKAFESSLRINERKFCKFRFYHQNTPWLHLEVEDASANTQFSNTLNVIPPLRQVNFKLFVFVSLIFSSFFSFLLHLWN